MNATTTEKVAPFKRHHKVGTMDTGYRTRADVTVDVEWTGERLSMTGTAKRPGARDIDQGGQMQDTISAMDERGLLVLGSERDRLVEIWNRWHLNEMRAECEHQRALGWTWGTHSSAECPECGYKLGSAWLREDVPAEILNELRTWPL